MGGGVKPIHSLGKHLNNYTIDDPEILKIKNRIRQSIDIKRLYKFSIASENACYPGYTSEKLLTSLQAHTIPIYWGDPLVAEEFNEKAFINCNNLEKLEDVIQIIKKIDSDDKLWMEIIQQPWQTDKQKKEQENNIQEYMTFISNIFIQPKNAAYRKSEGYHPNNYRSSFTNWKIKISIIQNLKMLRKKIINYLNNSGSNYAKK